MSMDGVEMSGSAARGREGAARWNFLIGEIISRAVCT